MANESVLVTGASGYIGSHCIVTLLEGEAISDINQNSIELSLFIVYAFSWL